MSFMVSPYQFAAAGGGGGGPVPTLDWSFPYRWGALAGGTRAINTSNEYDPGDVLLLLVETYNEAMPTPTCDGAVTFTEVTNFPLSNGTASTRLTVFEGSPCDGTETTLTFGDSGDHQIFGLLRISGSELPGGSAVHKIGALCSSTSSTSISLTGVTTTINNCAILGVVSQADIGSGAPGSWANASLTGVAALGGAGMTDGAGNNGGIGVGIGTLATAGASGTFTGTAGVTSWVGAQLAIR